MSQYANYDHISHNYDKTRKAVGIEIVLGFLASLPEESKDIRVLDAGCGTGNYATLIKRRFPNVVCLDFSMGMLQKAKEKFLSHGQAADTLIRCDMTHLPFQNHVFNAIICNQSLHHIDKPATDFKNQRTFFKKAYRILKPNGILLINTITHEQLRDGVWWGELIRPAVDRMIKHFTSNEKLKELLNDAGFEITDQVVPLNTIIQQQGYFDENALHRQEFRDGDSHFSLLTKLELQEVLSALDVLQSSGKLSAYIAERDQLRQRIGQFTYFVGRKQSTHD